MRAEAVKGLARRADCPDRVGPFACRARPNALVPAPSSGGLWAGPQEHKSDGMGDHPNTMPHRYRAAPQGPVAARPAPPPRKRWSDSPHYAALDLGTNNCRLLIARPAGTGFAVIGAFSRIVRMGEGLAAPGQLSEAAIDRTIAALRICADTLRRRTVTVARSVATAACRRAANGADFIERPYRETGLRLDIISAEEEARLAVLGC